MTWTPDQIAALLLGAADEAVPMVSEAEYSAEVDDRVRLSLNVTRDAWEAMEQRAERAEAAASDVASQLRSEIYGGIQTIRGMCTDEEPHERIDIALSALDDLIYSLAERLGPSFPGEEGTDR